MRILILDNYYPSFLDSFYGEHPGLSKRPYDEQWRVLMDQCFGAADFYSTNLIALGHEATEVVPNCESLQRQWAREHGINSDSANLIWRRRARVIPWPAITRQHDWHSTVLAAQLKDYRPDVLYIQDMNGVSAVFLRQVRQNVKLIVGQIACPIAPGADFREYDLVLSSFPHFVNQFRSEGLRSEHFKLGFEPRVLERIKPASHHNVVFIGGLSSVHAERIEFLEQFAGLQPIDVWGYGFDSLDPTSRLRQMHHGELWALDMYNTLYNSEIALNHHINVAGSYANNMRLYEATGVGTLLLTEDKDNLNVIFEPGKEVVAYRSAEEGVELARYYLTHEEERKTIARAGQARTLRDHTYRHRMQELLDILSRLI